MTAVLAPETISLGAGPLVGKSVHADRQLQNMLIKKIDRVCIAGSRDNGVTITNALNPHADSSMPCNEQSLG